MSIAQDLRPSLSTAILFAYVFFAQFISVLYAVRAIEVPASYDLLGSLAFLWLIWWWLRSDSIENGVSWPLDLGFFLTFAWIFIIPFHLFKTRGFRGLIGVFAYIVFSYAGYFAALILSWLIWQ